MANVFNTVPISRKATNTFDLSHDHKYSMQFGKVYPIMLQEAIPGDRYSLRSETLIRFAPLVAPIMHNISVFVHYFFVPNRIVWDEWEDFITNGNLGDDVPAHPYVSIDITNAADIASNGMVADYFGLPTVQQGTVYPNDGIKVNAIPFAAVNKVWNDYYRDQNLQKPLIEDLMEGDNTTSFYDGSNEDVCLGLIRHRAWMHDYFTSALPFAQKGGAVTLPLGDAAPVYRKMDGSPAGTYEWETITPAGQGVSVQNKVTTLDSIIDGELWTDLGTATAATINDLRTAIYLQQWYEQLARGGSRYIEQIKVMFNVVSSDARLQRPEFIGGTKVPVVISEVLQTSSTDDITPQANMAGHGISATSGKTYRYYCEEHGFIIGFISVMPKTAYQQGIPRKFLRETNLDYAWPTFAHLGEQAILNKELYVADDNDNDETFGYIPRYSEYRYEPSRVSGDFRTSLQTWHLSRIFGNRPQLNGDFIACDPRTNIFAVQDSTDYLWCHSYHRIFVNRKLPKYGVPSI